MDRKPSGSGTIRHPVWLLVMVICARVLAAAPAESQVVQVVYLVPSDREVREDYRAAADIAARDLQAFYQAQLGGSTFTLDPAGVLVLRSTHPASWFSTNQPPGVPTFTVLYNNVRADVEALLGRVPGSLHSGPDVWALYVDAQIACGQCGGCGAARVTVISRGDLRGLVGELNEPTCPGQPRDPNTRCRFIGGLGHELGHAFGLPHPPGCDQGLPTCDHQALMWSGYSLYRNTYLRGDEKTSLLATPYFSGMPALTGPAVCGPVPPAPPGAFAAEVDGSTIRFAWTVPQSAGAPNFYRLQVGSVPGAANLATLQIEGPTTTFTADAPPGSYYMRLIAFDYYGASAPSAEINVRVGLGSLPGAPADLNATLQGAVATLTWTPPAGLVDGYVLEAGSLPGASNVGQASLSMQPRFVSPPIPPGRYYVRVRARNAVGTGPPSADLILDVQGPSVPGSPTALAASVTGAQVSLSWSPPSTGPVLSYRLEAGTAPGLSNIAALDIGAIPAIAAANVPPGTYFVRIRGVNAVGIGTASNEVTVIVQ